MSEFTPAALPAAFDGRGRRYFVGRCFCYWQDGTRALGTTMWGKPLEADIAAMEPFFEIGAAPRFTGHASFVDGRSLEAIDLLAFKRLLAYLMTRSEAWSPNIGRQAVLHPGGVVGVIVAGALHVARPPHPFKTFAAVNSRDAFAWCRVPDLFEPLEALKAELTAVPEVIRSVQHMLSRDAGCTNAQLARELGLSKRTLQRRLAAAGSSVRTERQRHLSAQIEELLVGTELDLDAIAARVGLSSASHLVRYFRRSHGMSPSEWRSVRSPTLATRR